MPALSIKCYQLAVSYRASSAELTPLLNSLLCWTLLETKQDYAYLLGFVCLRSLHHPKIPTPECVCTWTLFPAGATQQTRPRPPAWKCKHSRIITVMLWTETDELNVVPRAVFAAHLPPIGKMVVQRKQLCSNVNIKNGAIMNADYIENLVILNWSQSKLKLIWVNCGNLFSSWRQISFQILFLKLFFKICYRKRWHANNKRI